MQLKEKLNSMDRKGGKGSFFDKTGSSRIKGEEKEVRTQIKMCCLEKNYEQNCLKHSHIIHNIQRK